MKKALSFAVALGLVGGMATTAVASDMLDFHGTARIRAIHQTADVAGVEVKSQEYDQRVRFQMNAKVSDTVTVKTRMTLRSDQLGQTDADTGDVSLDRAWIEIKDQAGTGGTWSYGRMPTNWSKFFSWGGTADRVKAIYKTDNGFFGGFIQKSTELQDATGDGDSDAYSLVYGGKAGDTKFKVIGVLTDDDTTGNSGHMLDVNVVSKAGGANIVVDLVHKDNDALADAQMGFQAKASMSVADGVTGSVALAYAKDGLTADDDFHPTLLIGTTQVTGLMNFGGDADTTYLVVAGAKMKLDDASSVSAALAYGDWDANDTSLIELDLTYKRNLAKNTDFALMASYADLETFGVGWDVTTLGWQITTKW